MKFRHYESILTLCLDTKKIVEREIVKREIREKRDRKEIE
jgi:hypothetical protein